MISTDKRCAKTKIKTRNIESYYEKVIPQRLFLPEDAIQVLLINSEQQQHCVVIRPMELPLIANQTYSLWS